ncbi:hypothetical protein SISSUDRAFT_1008008, partial [Sistotremastrum suecicum HHB10207 ss-3]
MDELVHYCLRELAFDGDLGCHISRLDDFIDAFFSTSSNPTTTVDAPMRALVWNALLQESSVHIGLVPSGAVEVVIAPQNATKRKINQEVSKSHRKVSPGADLVEEPTSALQAIENPEAIPVDQLILSYGDRLRIAVSHDSIMRAVTGSHIRPSKLTPMVYTALLLVTRGRENGISLVDLGAHTGYDQKTCFYLVKQLVELDLALKLKRPGVGAHFVVHRHFYEHSDVWKSIREEEAVRDEQESLSEGSASDNEETRPTVKFEPITSKHLSSLPLIKHRILKLLKNSPDNHVPFTNLIVAIGFKGATKSDRRFLRHRVKELVNEGVLQIVMRPGRRAASKEVQYITSSLFAGSQELGEDTQALTPSRGVEEVDDPTSHVLFNHSLQYQIIAAVTAKREQGITLTELSHTLGSLDRKVLENLLERLVKSDPPPHLADFGICTIMETHGKERRHRYLSLSAYRSLLQRESLEDPGHYATRDLSYAGSFFSDHLPATLFYRTNEELETYEDSFGYVSRNTRKPGKNPIGPNGKPKIGRPRKVRPDNDTVSAAPMGQPLPPPRKRGRPRKNPLPPENDDQQVSVAQEQGLDPDHGHSSQLAPGDNDVLAFLDGTADSSRETHTRGNDGRGKRKRVTEIPLSNETLVVEKPLDRPRKKQKVSKAIDTSTALVELQQLVSASADIVPLTHEQPEPEVLPGLHPGDLHELDAIMADVPPEPQHTPAPPVEEISTADQEVPSVVNADSPNSRLAGEGPEEQPAPSFALPDQTGPLSDTRLRSQINVSHYRREKEILEILESKGGIANVSGMEFQHAHSALVDQKLQAGELPSASVKAKMDRRSIISSVERLAEGGKLKIISTCTLHRGVQRNVKVAYLETVTEDEVARFLENLQKEEPIPPKPPKTRTRVEHADRVLEAHPGMETLKPYPSINRELEAEFGADHREILEHKQTIAQLYGYIVGKMQRAKLLHSYICSILSSGETFRSILSRPHAVIDMSGLCQEIPVHLYCAIVPMVTYNEDTLSILKTDEGRSTKISDLPREQRVALGTGRVRCKNKIQETLKLLSDLFLSTPLVESASPSPFVKVPGKNSAVSSFDKALLSDEGSPKYWKIDKTPIPDGPCPNPSHLDTEKYWQWLEGTLCFSNSGVPSSGPWSLPAETVTRLSNPIYWTSTYVFSGRQKSLLKRCAAWYRKRGLLYEERVEDLAHVAVAPPEAIRAFLRTSLSFSARGHGSAIPEKNKRKDVTPGPQSAPATDDRLNPSLAPPIQDTSSNAQDVTTQSFTSPAEPPRAVKQPPPRPVPLSPRPFTKSIDQLIAEQSMIIPLAMPVRGGESETPGTDVTASAGPGRRQRFQWTRDFDELARDAAVIIRSRCSILGKMDWSAIRQVFPLLKSNSVRQRTVAMRNASSGAKMYTQRLQDKWHQMWLLYRGTEYLPDPNLESTSEFPLSAHIDFLRNYIDKAALVVEFDGSQGRIPILLSDIRLLEAECDVIEGDGQYKWDGLWSWMAEDAREKTLLREPFILQERLAQPHGQSCRPAELISQAAVKMVMGTPSDLYDEDRAVTFLSQLNENQVSDATTCLLERGVLAKAQSDPTKRRPGRLVRISETNDAALGGSLPRQLWEDAAASLEDFAIGELQDWPLLSGDGDTAAMIDLVS